jgi:hypothetical protein
MKTLMLLLLAAMVLQVAACTERYDEVYQDGFLAGRTAAFNEVSDLRETARARFSAHAVDGDRDMSTEVCGAGGIILNGVHVSFGNSSCVRVYADGSVARY